MNIARPSFAEDGVGKPGKEHGHEDMRTEMELLRQQVRRWHGRVDSTRPSDHVPLDVSARPAFQKRVRAVGIYVH